MRVVARWDEAAAQQPREQPFGVDDYVRWTLSLYDEMAPLREGVPRAPAGSAARHRLRRGSSAAGGCTARC